MQDILYAVWTLLVLLNLIQYLSFLTGNKAPGLVPNKFLYMTKDMKRLNGYFGVPLEAPSDPFEVMFNKGTYKQI